MYFCNTSSCHYILVKLTKPTIALMPSLGTIALTTRCAAGVAAFTGCVCLVILVRASSVCCASPRYFFTRSFQQYIFYTEQHCKNTGDSEKIIYLLPRKENINSLSHIVKVQPEQRPIPVASRTVNSQPVPWNKVVKGETQKEGGE